MRGHRSWIFRHRFTVITFTVITIAVITIAGFAALTVGAVLLSGMRPLLAVESDSESSPIPRDERPAVPEDNPDYQEVDDQLDVPNRYPVQAFGKLRKVVILVRFSNHKDRPLPERAVYEALLNGRPGDPFYPSHGSGLDYSLEVSYGLLEVTADVIGWVDLPHSEEYYAGGRSGFSGGGRVEEAVRDAVTIVDRQGLIDKTLMDSNGDDYLDVVSLIHSGYGAEVGDLKAEDGTLTANRIWSHQSSFRQPWQTPVTGLFVTKYVISSGLWGSRGHEPCRLGLLVHETFHMGDLEDLYDTSRKRFSKGRGAGAWTVMAEPNGFGRISRNPLAGYSPSHIDPYSREQLGWAKPIALRNTGTIRVRDVERHRDIYKIQEGFPDGEYILIENRQPTGFDRDLPGGLGGLAIWHVDTNQETNDRPGYPGQAGWPANNRHYRVALLQADGRYDLERDINSGDATDLFRGGGGVDTIRWDTVPPLKPYREDPSRPRVRHSITRISESGPLMTFHYQIERLPPDPSLTTSTSAASLSVSGESTATGLGSARTTTSESVGADQSLRQKVTASATDTASATSAYSPPPLNELATPASEQLIPVGGATMTFEEFSPDERKAISDEGTLLKVALTLKHRSEVHVDASTSVSLSEPQSTLTTGIATDGPDGTWWPESIRRVSTARADGHVIVAMNCARTLPPGRHVLHWKASLPGARMKFDAGGTLFVRAFPCVLPHDANPSDTRRPGSEQ